MDENEAVVATVCSVEPHSVVVVKLSEVVDSHGLVVKGDESSSEVSQRGSVVKSDEFASEKSNVVISVVAGSVEEVVNRFTELVDELVNKLIELVDELVNGGLGPARLED
jgi:ribose 1,5-bisphosphokinase PhnN